MRLAKRLFYNWNNKKNVKRKVVLHDETLRDGLQATYVRNPSLEQKIALLRLMEELGIHSANIGFPGAGSRHEEDVTELAKYKKAHRLKIKLTCASRALIDDLIPIVRAQENSGVQLEAGVFLGSSEIRKLVERWSLRDMGRMVRESIRFAIKNNLSVMFVTEDTTRAKPEVLKYLYGMAITEGATRLCIADTVGFATPNGVEKLVRFVIEKIINGQAVKVDWHGHRDRSVEIANCFAAIDAGVDRVHGTALGVGERAGNVPIDLLMVNLKVEGFIRNNLEKLPEYAKFASIILDISTPDGVR